MEDELEQRRRLQKSKGGVMAFKGVEHVGHYLHSHKLSESIASDSSLSSMPCFKARFC